MASKKLEGHEAMVAWDKTWQHGKLPMWARKAVRLHEIKCGRWEPCLSSEYQIVSRLSLFDHWGSVQRSDGRVLIAQPYGDHDKEAAEYAENLGWNVKSSRSGPWSDGTWYYEFSPK